jgi:hypothetical protein
MSFEHKFKILLMIIAFSNEVTKIRKNVLQWQNWRKKSEHSRKNATFADCLRTNGLTIISRPFDKLRDLGSIPLTEVPRQ